MEAPPTSYAALLSHCEAWRCLCERTGVPEVLLKFPLTVKPDKGAERELLERQQETRLKRQYAQLIDGIYRRRILGTLNCSCVSSLDTLLTRLATWLLSV